MAHLVKTPSNSTHIGGSKINKYNKQKQQTNKLKITNNEGWFTCQRHHPIQCTQVFSHASSSTPLASLLWFGTVFEQVSKCAWIVWTNRIAPLVETLSNSSHKYDNWQCGVLIRSEILVESGTVSACYKTSDRNPKNFCWGVSSVSRFRITEL